jgi:hypothetical protein
MVATLSDVMSRLVAALMLVGTLVIVPVSASAGERPPPALRVTALAPVQVAGRHFNANERVRLHVTRGETTVTRTVNATRLGGFRTTFTGISITDRCSSALLVRAVGARGSRASVKLPQLHCPPALSPS